MGIMSRIEIITEAKNMIGPSATPISLVREYDWVLREITSQFPIIRNQQKTGSVVANQNYLILPPNFAFKELFKIGGNEIDYVEPEDWRENYDEDDASGTPSIWTVIRTDKKLYMHASPSTALAYILYYTATHPPSGRSIAFTSGGTYEIKPGVTVTGATSTATGVVDSMTLTSGTWAAGTAAGVLVFSSQTGTFSAENLNVGTDLNVASVAANSGIADAFEHFLGEEFDEAIIFGVASKGCLKIPGKKEESLFFKGAYRDAIEIHANIFGKRFVTTSYYDF